MPRMTHFYWSCRCVGGLSSPPTPRSTSPPPTPAPAPSTSPTSPGRHNRPHRRGSTARCWEGASSCGGVSYGCDGQSRWWRGWRMAWSHMTSSTSPSWWCTAWGRGASRCWVGSAGCGSGCTSWSCFRRSPRSVAGCSFRFPCTPAPAASCFHPSLSCWSPTPSSGHPHSRQISPVLCSDCSSTPRSHKARTHSFGWATPPQPHLDGKPLLPPAASSSLLSYPLPCIWVRVDYTLSIWCGGGVALCWRVYRWSWRTSSRRFLLEVVVGRGFCWWKKECRVFSSMAFLNPMFIINFTIFF